MKFHTLIKDWVSGVLSIKKTYKTYQLGKLYLWTENPRFMSSVGLNEDYIGF